MKFILFYFKYKANTTENKDDKMNYMKILKNGMKKENDRKYLNFHENIIYVCPLEALSH